VVGIYMEMDFVRMITKRVAVDGYWFNLYFFQEEDGVRVEMEQELSGKRHKLFPDNKVQFE
jgi:hypothetical protein